MKEVKMDIKLQLLKVKIRGFHATGQSIAHRISKVERERKTKLWEQKRLLGWHSRHHQVAYGLLRGIPYSKIERCAEHNGLNASMILSIMLEHFNACTGPRPDLAKVKELLSTAVTCPPETHENVA